MRSRTRAEADDYGVDLHRRWTLVVEHRSVESPDPVSYTFEGGVLRRITTVTP